MNTFAKNILITSILAITANTALIAQTSNSQFDQWYRAKYGRPAPTAQALLTSRTPATLKPSAVTIAAPGFEQWYLAKYGRPAPAQEARQEQVASNDCGDCGSQCDGSHDCCQGNHTCCQGNHTCGQGNHSCCQQSHNGN